MRERHDHRERASRIDCLSNRRRRESGRAPTARRTRGGLCTARDPKKLKAVAATGQLKRPLARPTNISLNDLATLLAAHFGVDVSRSHVPSASVSNVMVQTLLPDAGD